MRVSEEGEPSRRRTFLQPRSPGSGFGRTDSLAERTRTPPTRVHAPAPARSAGGRASRAIAGRAMPGFGGNRGPLRRTFPCEVRRSRGEPRRAWPSSSAHVDPQLLEAVLCRGPTHPHGRPAAPFAEQDVTSGQDRLPLAGEGQEGLEERGVLAHALLHPPQALAVVEELLG